MVKVQISNTRSTASFWRLFYRVRDINNRIINCKHVQTRREHLLPIDRWDDTALEGGIVLRCMNCRRIVEIVE